VAPLLSGKPAGRGVPCAVGSRGGSTLRVAPERKPMLAASTLLGLLAGSAAGLASSLWPGASGAAAAALYVAGLAGSVLYPGRRGLAGALEAALAFSSLFLGFWVGVYNLLLG